MRFLAAEPAFFALISVSRALQVTPNSPCAMQCMDNMNDSPTDPNSSNTYGTDITCNNGDYTTSAVGQKFKSCLNCLQNSAYSSSTESDQAWFLYNLRYAVDWCLYGYPSNGTGIGGPCLTPSACGGLATALESGIANPSSASTYDYCSADSGTLGQYYDPCRSCLIGLSPNSYLSNFMVALEAGCNQKPPTGTVIGLNDTVFTSTQVAITTASAPSSTGSASAGPSGLSTGAKIGIVVGSLIFILIVVACSFIWWKKRQHKSYVESRYDPRFGAPEISAPNEGAFVNQSSQISPTSRTFVKYKLGEHRGPGTSLPGDPEHKLHSPASTTDVSSKHSSQPSSPPYTGASIPVHQAYYQNPKQAYSPPISPESPSAPKSAPSHAHSRANSATNTTPPNSAPIATRNFSTPTGAVDRRSQGSSPAITNPSAIPSYNPSTYTLQSESRRAQSRQAQPPRLNVPAPLRPSPGRSQAWNTESSHSVELWPGSM